MTPDQMRRSIRKELHAARCRDGDHSADRYFNDGRALDSRLTEAGAFQHPSTWGMGSDAQKGAGKSTIAPSDDPECQANLFDAPIRRAAAKKHITQGARP